MCMKKYLLIAMFFVVSCHLFAVQRPRLVVGIVVDQMRWDYLYRYTDRWTDGGFNRLMREGYNFENTHYNYIPTVTAAGHCVIYAGTTPAITGIAGNNFYVNGKKTYCCEDGKVHLVGVSGKGAGMSPSLSQVTSMCDQLRLATDFESKVIGVALKDRAAILPAGHSANAAYWFDLSAKGFITSSYYMNDLPEWVKTFNRSNRSKVTENLFSLPAGLELTTRMAMAAVDNERLGQGNATDFLAVSYSPTDYVGHIYGTRGDKTDEIYVAIDREINQLLRHLDQTVGKGNYLLFLTADHAAAHNAKYLNDHGIPAGRIDYAALQKRLNEAGKEKFSTDNLVLDIIENRVYLNHRAIEAQKLSLRKVRNMMCEEILKDEHIIYALPFDKVETATIPPAIKQRIIMGYHPKRSGDLQIIPQAGYTGAPYGQGTTHVAWNPYDTHVTCILYGCNIQPGKSLQTVWITDIAPTICAFLHIQMPSGCTGEPRLW